MLILKLIVRNIFSHRLRSIIIFSVINKQSDIVAYNDVVATMSMYKAKQFFDDYPNSPYIHILVDELIKWCKQEKTEETYKLILATMPKNHKRYNELLIDYKEIFLTEQN